MRLSPANHTCASNLLALQTRLSDFADQTRELSSHFLVHRLEDLSFKSSRMGLGEVKEPLVPFHE